MNNDLMFSSANQAWDTPQDLYDKLNKEFGFTLDPCCTSENCKAPTGLYFDKGHDGLKELWSGNVFMNPPYSDLKFWIPKAVYELQRCNVIVGLIPARTDTIIFHSYIWDLENNKPRDGVEVRFLKGRLIHGSEKYWSWLWDQEFVPDGKGGQKKNSLYKKYGKKNSAPFPSMVVIWKK